MNKEPSARKVDTTKEIPKVAIGIGAAIMALSFNAPPAIVATELITQEVLWQQDEAKINVLAGDFNAATDEMVVVLPGLGQKSGYDTARALSPTLSELGPVTYAEYPDSGFGDDRGMLAELAREIQHTMQEQNKSQIAFYAHSMGSIVLLRLLPYLDPSTITRIQFDCSPLNEDDAVDKDAAAWALRFKDLPHGILSKIGVEFYNNFVRFPDTSQPLTHRLSETIRIASGGSSTQLWLDELELYFETEAKDYVNYWPKHAKVSYFMPQESINDTTVYVEKAAKKWDEVFDIDMGIFTIPGSGHANPADHPEAYNQAVYAALFGNIDTTATVALPEPNIQTTPANEPGSNEQEDTVN